MVTLNKKVVWDHWEFDVKCLSTDEKPVIEIPNGTPLTEIDTGNFYMFDSSSGNWVFQFCMQG